MDTQGLEATRKDINNWDGGRSHNVDELKANANVYTNIFQSGGACC